MPEAKPDPVAASPLAPFDESAPRPVPPVSAQDGATITRLVAVMRRLLAPDGCPWDREQSLETLRKYVIEETCEVVDAIDAKDRGSLREELGDLLLQIVFQSELTRAEGAFALDDVVAGIVDKLVARHPHVFGAESVSGADDVVKNWEKIKAAEKARRGVTGGILSGVPRSMSALTRAQRIGEKVAKVGFDWPDVVGSRAKVTEEVGELDRAIASGDSDAVEEELGDALFALVNLARHVGVDAEAALRRTSEKFVARFAHVEARVRALHGGWNAPGAADGHLPLEVLDRYWEEAKRGPAS
jgi:tetrapyrrole methylase family protein/MazG family protein/ATP diphosphatase